MKRMLRVAFFVAVGSIATVLVRASADEGKSEGPDAEKVLSAWAAPGAPANRNASRPVEHKDIAREEYTADKSFQVVWEHFAAKCGVKEKYEPGLTLLDGGGDKKARWMMTLRQNPKPPGTAYCQFAVHAETFWIVIDISSRDLTAGKTAVNVVAGAR